MLPSHVMVHFGLQAEKLLKTSLFRFKNGKRLKKSDFAKQVVFGTF